MYVGKKIFREDWIMVDWSFRSNVNLIDISNFKSVPMSDKVVNIKIYPYCILVCKLSGNTFFIKVLIPLSFCLRQNNSFMFWRHNATEWTRLFAIKMRPKESGSIFHRWLSIKIKMLIGTFIVSLNKSSKAPPWFSFRFNIMLPVPPCPEVPSLAHVVVKIWTLGWN